MFDFAKRCNRHPFRYAYNLNTEYFIVLVKIKARTGMSPPIGERIPFVIIADRGLFVDRAEDPDYVRENNIPLDVDYYIEKMLTSFALTRTTCL